MTIKNKPSKRPVQRRKVLARTATAKRMLAPDRLLESLSLNRSNSPFMAGIAGLQAALSLLAAIVLVRHSLWPELVAFPALGALAALFGRFAPLPKRHGIVWLCALQLTGAVFVTSLASYIGLSPAMVVLVVALVAALSTIAFSYWNLGGPGAVIIVFAAGAAMTPVDSWMMVVERTVATAGGGLVAWLITTSTDFLRLPALSKVPADTDNRRPLKNILIAGARIGAGAAAAALIAYAAGWQHPSWAAIGATAVMQGGHLHITMHRALQRMAGTLFGSLLVWLILSADPPFWAIVTAIAVFQYITEIIIGFNYALGQITVTPMALLMTSLAMPAAKGADMAIERVFDTMLGAILGIAFAVLFSTLDDRRYLATYHRARKSGRPMPRP